MNNSRLQWPWERRWLEGDYIFLTTWIHLALHIIIWAELHLLMVGAHIMPTFCWCSLHPDVKLCWTWSSILSIVVFSFSLRCVMWPLDKPSLSLSWCKAHESHQVASLSACWAAIRASQWLGKLLLFPNQGDLEKSGRGTCVDHQPPSKTCEIFAYMCILHTHDDNLLCAFVAIIVVIKFEKL